MTKLRRAAFCFLWLWMTTGTAVGGGVTVITHGFNSNADGWVLQMCQRIPHHPAFRGRTASLYKISIARPGGVYTVGHTFLQGAAPLASNSGHIIIALDWSTISGLFQPSTSEIGTQVAGALLSTNLIPELGGRALAELPLHLIGHSRGASMMAEVARLLGAQGVWVDHLTLLDPYPYSGNGDPTLRNYANVFFTDNYRQTYNFPTGRTLSGTYDRVLTGLTSGGYAAGSEHSDVHLWYHGTVDFRTPVTVGGATLTAAERSNWWSGLEQSGTNAGFVYSLIAGGNRFLASHPAGSPGSVSDGVNKMWDFGAGLAGNRTTLTQNNGSWPNVIRLSHDFAQRAPGNPLQIDVQYQHGSDGEDAATLALCLDTDLNPWNGNHIEIGSIVLAGTGVADVGSATLPVNLNAPPGDYRLFARTTLGTRSRYCYAPGEITSPPLLVNAQRTGQTFTFSILGQTGWRVVLEASENLVSWTPVSTNVMSVASQQVSTSSESAHRFFRAVLR